MKIFFQNSLSGKLDEFIPVDPQNVRMYVCGPTVYDTPHIGNARPLIIFDVLYRLLTFVYPSVTYVRNITDVDDKINNRAKNLGISIRELTDGIIEKFHNLTSKLNILPVTHEPRATDHINEMIEIVDLLVKNGFAYEAEGHVLYRVRKNAEYGKLSKRNLDDMRAGNRVEVAPYKEDPMDFVLWKPSEEGQPAWDCQFGKGRPGWHLECSAMSHKYLGKNFDIHGGGRDLEFPHHENEMAQNYGAFGCQMANYWIHNGMLLVDGQKMSKSVGNIIRLDDALETLDGETIRYALLSTHYQKTLDWTAELVNESKTALDRLYSALDGEIEVYEYGESPVVQALANNLNTPLALRALHAISDEIFKEVDTQAKVRLRHKLANEAKFLGLLTKNPQNWFTGKVSNEEIDLIEKLISDRIQAKKDKNFALADEIRQTLTNMGILLEDKKDGTTKWKRA